MGSDFIEIEKKMYCIVQKVITRDTYGIAEKVITCNTYCPQQRK